MAGNLDYLSNMLQGLHDPQSAPPQAAPAVAPQSQPMVAPMPQGAGPVPGNPVGQPVPDAPVPHTGAFGIHGGLRTALGIFGDAMLAQAGKAPQFAPKMQQERESDALQGFANNPLAAIQRLSAVNPKAATDMYNEYITQTRVNRMADEQYMQTVANRGLSMLGAATPQNYQQIKAQIEGYASQRNVNLPFQLPDTYDKDTLAGIQREGMSTEQQHQADATDAWRNSQMGYRYANLDERGNFHNQEIKQGDRRIGVSQQVADAKTQSAGAYSDSVADRSRHNQVTEGQGQQAIDQVTAGDRGVPMRLRPRPGSLVQRVGPDGRTIYGRVVAVDAKGNPTKVIPAN